MKTNLKNIREGKKLSQKQLADLAKTTDSYICKIETGERNPGLQMLIRLSKALNCSLIELLNLEN